jgi:hypothetical protein
MSPTILAENRVAFPVCCANELFSPGHVDCMLYRRIYRSEYILYGTFEIH